VKENDDATLNWVRTVCRFTQTECPHGAHPMTGPDFSRGETLRLQQGGAIMFALVLTIIGFAGAMSVPILLTAIVESATSNIRPASV
jgi:hypothetical protein